MEAVRRCVRIFSGIAHYWLYNAVLEFSPSVEFILDHLYVYSYWHGRRL